MSWSLGETQAMAAKACVGAGYSWGQAEDAGLAVRALCAQGRDGAGLLAAVILANDAKQLGPETCPICHGTQIADGLQPITEAPLTLPEMLSPELLVPFLSWRATRQKQCCVLSLPGATYTCNADGSVVIDGTPDAKAAAPTLHTASADRPTKPAPATRARISPATQAVLKRFAGRTYAPATEESRAKGAG